MAVTVSDIEFFLSGGSTNSNPNNSLGGGVSSSVLIGSMNNLFSNLTSEQAASGWTDYRCFYVINGSASDSLYDPELRVESQKEGGSSISIGVQTSMEVQTVTINGPVYYGGLDMRYESTPFSVAWGGSPATFGANLESALGSVAPGASVEVEVQGNKNQFTISFEGASDGRSHPLLEMVSNGLLAPDLPIVSISRLASGSPVNSIAPSLAVATVPPARVVFSNGGISIGALGPGDSVPVWVRRTTPSGTDYSKSDNFVFKISGRPF